MPEIAQTISDAGVARASAPFRRLFILGILAGVYIAFVASASNMAAFGLLADPATFGLGRCLAGVIFPGGLVLITLAGGELFTGNTMMLLPLSQRRIRFIGLLRNWCVVYAANLIGTVSVAWFIFSTGQMSAGNYLLGGVVIDTAAIKCNFTFYEAFVLGILCNWLVCLAIWTSTGAKDTPGKIMAIFFPICLFVIAGFEHSIANMYFISMGLFAKSNLACLAAAQQSQEVLASLTWANFFVANLLPVTLGNIVGGGVFVALAYGYVFQIKSEKSDF